VRFFIVLVLLLCSFLSKAQIYSASNFTLIGQINPETGTNSGGDKYSGCWGWHQAAKQKEYAIACGQAGTYWIDVTNPSTPTVSAYVAGTFSGSTWREAKTYLNYCYVVCDDPGTNSFQIFDMQYLPDSVVKVYDGQEIFKRGHTLWVDNNKLYVASVQYSNNTYSSMDVYSLANPASPLLLRSLKQDYPFINRVHDMFVRNDTIFASCEYQGLYVFKLTALSTFTQLGSLTSYTYSGYNHSSALTPDGKTLVFTDEIPNGMPFKIANVTNLSNIQISATANQFSLTTPHNPFITSNRYCFMSGYEDGLQLYNILNPSAPFLAGYFDTHPQSGGNTNSWSNPYGGQWGCYPFFPSGNIFALDQSNGVFMLRSHLHPYAPGTTVGIFENENQFNMQLYPNPAQTTVRFNIPTEHLKSALKVNIISAQGELVAEKKDHEVFKINALHSEIDVSTLAPGIYFFQVIAGEQLISSKKLVISN